MQRKIPEHSLCDLLSARITHGTERAPAITECMDGHWATQNNRADSAQEEWFATKGRTQGAHPVWGNREGLPEEETFYLLSKAEGEGDR